MKSSTNITGNLTRDPELKFLQNGAATVRFSVAVNEKWNDRQGNPKEKTSYFDCDAIGDIAKNIADSLKKGDRVVIAGNFEQRTWETPEGEKRSVIELKVESIGPDLRFAVASVQRTAHSIPGRQGANADYHPYEEPF